MRLVIRPVGRSNLLQTIIYFNPLVAVLFYSSITFSILTSACKLKAVLSLDALRNRPHIFVTTTKNFWKILMLKE